MDNIKQNKNSLDPHKESKQDSYRDNRIFGIKCKWISKNAKLSKILIRCENLQVSNESVRERIYPMTLQCKVAKNH